MKIVKFLMAAAASLAIAGGASAATISSGKTQVTVTADLGGLGLTGAPFGTATADGATFTFPITGGTVDATAVIEHDGSGVTLTAAADADTSVTVGNFVIDTSVNTIFGDVIGGPAGLDLFNLGAADGGIGVNISATLAGALTSIFGAPDLTGAQFGVATTAPETAPVPVPASALLLLTGLGAAGAMRRRSA